MSSSSGNSPHRFSGSIDTFYDPEFTADISKKMRVPEKLVIDDSSRSFNGFDDPAIIAAKKLANTGPTFSGQSANTGPERPVWMTVPERILVMGNESHMSGREPLPELKLENSLIGMSGDYTTGEESPVQLTTPPHTLTLSEHHFPTVDDTHNTALHSNGPTIRFSNNKKNRNTVLSGLTGRTGADDSLLLLESLRKDSVESPEYQSYYNSNVSANELTEDSVVLRRQLKALSRRMAAIEVENQHRYQREIFVYTVGVLYFVIKGIVWIQRQL